MPSQLGSPTTTRELARYTLKRVFGFDGFRGVQEDVIVAALGGESAGRLQFRGVGAGDGSSSSSSSAAGAGSDMLCGTGGQDVFCTMPTGGGKSMCYIIPALLRPGVTVVVSPLLSLIQDQVVGLASGSLSKFGVAVPAAALTSELSAEEAKGVYRELHKEPGRRGHGDGTSMKLLFVTPEKLMSSEALSDALDGLYNRRYPGTQHRMLSRFVIDEAHCVSQWGHDFRPDYKMLKALRHSYPDVPIMALTATGERRGEGAAMAQHFNPLSAAG